MIRIELINRSVRCFFLGLFGLLFPIFGMGLTVAAIRQNRRVREIQNGQWNPAESYRHWGMVFARLGVALLAIELTTAAAICTIELR